jgi:hypothetical protein
MRVLICMCLVDFVGALSPTLIREPDPRCNGKAPRTNVCLCLSPVGQ